MNLIDALLSYLAPHECVGCTAEGRLICPACGHKLRHVSAVQLMGSGQIQARTHYGRLAKALIWKLKAGSARAAADEIAQLLPVATSGVVVPVPTASSRVRQRGYDQAVLIARAYARRTKLPYRKHLARQYQTRQVGASRMQRQKQLAGAFRITMPALLKDEHIILIDDVSTTGATLKMAAQTLLRAGARRVDAIVFARVP